MPPKEKKAGTGAPTKKSTSTSTKTNSLAKKQTQIPPTSDNTIMTYQQLKDLLRTAQHKLPMLPSTALSFIHSTFSKRILQHFKKEHEVETGLVLGYLAHRMMCPHPFIHRRDFMLNQPGKIGGFPSWLIPQNIPTTICQHCTNPMTFILQFSAPISYPDEEDYNSNPDSDAFKKHAKLSEQTTHRMLYLFSCTNVPCVIQNNSVKVLRAQLPLANPFYLSKPTQYIPETTPSTHDFRYPFETIITPLSTPPTPTLSNLCIMCGGNAILCCEHYGPDLTTPIYCSELHKQYNISVFHINASSPLTLNTPLDSPSPPSTSSTSSFLQTATAQNLLESTVLFPRFGLRTDFEVLDDEVMTHFQDTFDLQIEEFGTQGAAINQMLSSLSSEHVSQIGIQTDDHRLNANDILEATTTEVKQTSSQESSADVSASIISAGQAQTDDRTADGEQPDIEVTNDQQNELLQEQELIEQYLSQINDPQLRSQIDSYLKEEKGKSLMEKLGDIQTYSPSLDEADNYSMAEQDPTFQHFQRRIELTLPPYSDEGLDIAAETDTALQLPQIQQYLAQNPYNSYNVTKGLHFNQQILRFHPYFYRTSHLHAEPIWTHKLNRLHLNDYTISTPNALSVTPTTVISTDDVIMTPVECDYRKCPNCHGNRLLEAQLMPYLCTFLLSTIESQHAIINKQLSDPTLTASSIHQLPTQIKTAKDLSQFDFSTIAIFTCENSCSPEGGQFGYVEEFAYLQPAL